MEPIKIGEIYEKISKDEIKIPPDFKIPVLDTLENFGIDLIKKQKYWQRRHPVEIIDEINAHLLESIVSGKTHEGAVMGEAELTFQKQLRIVFYHIRRCIRDLLKEEDS